MKKGWKIFFWVVALIILVLVVVSYSILFPPIRGDALNTGDLEIPTFSELDIDFVHIRAPMTHPFHGSAVIDVNGDGKEEIFIGGGGGQDDALFSYENGEFVNIISGTGLSKKEGYTYGAVSLDINQDGEVDLILARESGLFIYFNDNGFFTETEIPLNLESGAIVTYASPGDINKDGFVDLYIGTFVHPSEFKVLIFNDPEIAKADFLLLNNGDNTFTDITESSGVVVDQNTFAATFVDLDNDGWQDIVVSPNTDRVYIFKNNGDSTFTKIPSPTEYGTWMGLSVGDIDNDLDQDIFFSNMGNFLPEFMVRGDLTDDQVLDREWMLLRNDGDMKFTKITEEADLENLDFSWGSVLEDFNLDGRIDLLVGENYPDWWVHRKRQSPGHFLLQNADGKFVITTKASGLENRNFGQTPLVLDFNDDGYLDVILVNMVGPLRAFLNDGGDNNYISVLIKDNVESLGAKVIIKQGDIELTKYFIPATGLMSDQTNELVFGLGDNKDPVNIIITLLSGETKVLENVEVNQKIIY